MNIKNLSILLHILRTKEFQVGSEYQHQNILSLKSFKLANKEISSWDKYEPTPLYYLSDLAKYSSVSSIAYKDEKSSFFHLKVLKLLVALMR